MKDEITRTSSADRERYINHLPVLYARGIIGEEELDVMSGRILRATRLDELDDILMGMPKPVSPRRPRDLGIPGNFLPPCAVAALFGLTLAVIPPVALSGNHSVLAVTVSALCVLWGTWVVLVTVVTAAYAAAHWGDQGADVKADRRRKDQRGR